MWGHCVHVLRWELKGQRYGPRFKHLFRVRSIKEHPCMSPLGPLTTPTASAPVIPCLGYSKKLHGFCFPVLCPHSSHRESVQPSVHTTSLPRTLLPASCRCKPKPLQWPPQLLHTYLSPCSLTPIAAPPSPHSAPAMLASLLLLEHTKHTSASGPLYLILSLQCSSPGCHMTLFLISFRSLLTSHLLREVFFE